MRGARSSVQPRVCAVTSKRCRAYKIVRRIAVDGDVRRSSSRSSFIAVVGNVAAGSTSYYRFPGH